MKRQNELLVRIVIDAVIVIVLVATVVVSLMRLDTRFGNSEPEFTCDPGSTYTVKEC